MRLWVIDDAGRRVRLVDQLEFFKQRRSARLTVSGRRIVRAMEPPYSRLLAGVGIAVLFSLLLRPLIVSAPQTNPSAKDSIYMALALCVPLVLLLVPVFLNRSRASRIFAEGLLGEGICPSCGYNFAGLERRPGTLLVCPECGSSWQSERIGRAVADTESTPAESELERALRPEALRTVRDDRRRITIQQDYTLRAAIRWATDKAHRDRLRSVQRKLKRRGRGVRVLSGVLVISALAVLMLIMQPYIDPRQFVISLMVGSLLAPVIWFGSLGRGGGRRIQTGLKRAGLCPSCGADLSGLGEEPDGCRVCTVCRSAWRLAA